MWTDPGSVAFIALSDRMNRSLFQQNDSFPVSLPYRNVYKAGCSKAAEKASAPDYDSEQILQRQLKEDRSYKM